MDFSWLLGLQIAFGSMVLIQAVYHLGFFSRLAWHKRTKIPQPLQPVSVIIVAKNEERNLQKNLHLFFEQNHPEYEIVVVNNASWDGTAEFLKETAPRYPNLRIVTIEEQERYPKGKKFAITLGIKASKYDVLLLTDADCVPASPEWITKMQQAYTTKTEVVLGYGAYEKHKGLLNYIIRYETFYTALQYLSFALAGKAYMGVGRNLSYLKSKFFAVKGFATHNHIVSGDDDLFVNEVARPDNVAVCISPGAFTLSEPKKTFGEWLKQKRRHLHTGKHYKGDHKFMLALLNISHILFYATAITLLAMWYEPEVVAVGFGLRLLIMLVVFYNAMQKLREKNLIWGLLFLDAFYFIYYMLMGLRTLFTRQKKGVW